jgi:uncharacterized protein (UPF0264 family)
MKPTINPRLLVSVRSVEEAHIALRGGADVIDIKEPSRGPLGKADDTVIAAILNAIAGRAPVSVALGELIDEPRLDVPRANFVKVGLAHAPADWRQRLSGRHLIAVAYADYHRAGAPPVEQVLNFALHHDVAGMLIDTAVKDGHGLSHWCEDKLPRWIKAMQDTGRLIALAGALHGDAFDRVATMGPDILAVRGAACRGDDRMATIDADRVASLKARLSTCKTSVATATHLRRAAAPAG